MLFGAVAWFLAMFDPVFVNRKAQIFRARNGRVADLQHRLIQAQICNQLFQPAVLFLSCFICRA